jgi:hypothetical protein
VNNSFNLFQYENLMAEIKAYGWEFDSFHLALQGQRQSLALRHDIDAELYLLDSFLNIERKMEVKATYFVMLDSPFYNPSSPEGRRIINTIIDDGHSFGLHFFGEIYADLTVTQLELEIRRQVQRLSDLVNAPVEVFSYHQPTREMMSAQLNIPGLINTYHLDTMSRLFYLTDTNLGWNPQILATALDNRAKPIQMLTHPLWWLTDDPTQLAKWRSLLQSLSQIHARHLLERERTLHGRDISELL